MKDYELKASEEKDTFASGAVRDSIKGKGKFVLLPAEAMRRLAIHFEKGSEKYGDNNWKRGMPVGRFLDSALRHIFNYLAEKDDEDHLVAAAWNLVAALETESMIEDNKLPKELLDVGPNKYQDFTKDPPVPHFPKTQAALRDLHTSKYGV